MLKRISAVFAALLLFAGCATLSDDETAFRDWLTADYTSVLECENNIYKGYTDTLNALEKYCTSESEETKKAFLEAVELNKTNIQDNLHPQTSITEDTYGIMEKYNIPLDDYIWFVSENYPESRLEYDNFDNAVLFVQSDNTEGAGQELEFLKKWFAYSRKYMLYSMMDMVAESGESNIDYFKSVVDGYEYISQDNTEWLSDRDAIMQAAEQEDNNFLTAMDEHTKYINSVNAQNIE